MLGTWMISALASTALAATPVASSEWRDADGTRHSAVLAFDGLLETSWAADDGDEDLWLELRLDGPTQVESVSVWPGDLTGGAASFRASGRPVAVTVQLVTDAPEAEWPTAVSKVRGDTAEPQRLDIPVSGRARKVRIKLDAVEGGRDSARVFVAEAGVNFAAGEQPAAVAAVGTWSASSSAEKATAELQEEVVAFFAGLTAPEAPEPVAEETEPAEASPAEEPEPFDKDAALASLLTWASDGAPHVRARVARYVPAGFRMSALAPEPRAVEALVKLRDPAAIAGLEKAALRSTGRDQQRLSMQIAYYYALAELQDGAPSVPAWGAPGWGTGAIQSFGEVPNLEADQFGRVLVADIGNHRVQAFNSDGRVSRTWAAPSTEDDHSDQVTNVWLSGKRRFYVAGAPPSEADGGFTLPLDVAILPGKEADGFAVLDASKRVQIFDGAGALVRSWPVRVEDELVTGVGGQAFLVNAAGKLAVVWGTEVVVFDQEAEELQRFSLKRGEPAGAVGLKNGKLGLIYGQDLQMYSLDGFEHGSIVGDDLPEGFENWDVDVDENGALWLMTDTGWILKYKKPGKLELKVRAVEESLGYLRIAASGGKLHLLTKDHIRSFDAASLVPAEGE